MSNQVPHGPWVIKGHLGNYSLCGGSDGGFLLAATVQPDLVEWLVKNGLARWSDEVLGGKLRGLIESETDDNQLASKIRDLFQAGDDLPLMWQPVHPEDDDT